MKKILGIVVLGLLLTINPAYSKVGKGNLTFSPEVLENFLKYLRNELATSFVVTKDGKFALYGLCRDKSRGCQGGPGSTATLMKNCKKEYGEKCFIFAQRKNFKSDPSSSYINISKKIRWNNVDYEFPKEKTWKGMGYGESKGEGIKKDISDDQIKSVLNELGFINFNKVEQSIVTTEASVVPKVEKKLTKQQQIEIDQIKEMFDIGALTKEEYDNAIKRALN